MTSDEQFSKAPLSRTVTPSPEIDESLLFAKALTPIEVTLQGKVTLFTFEPLNTLSPIAVTVIPFIWEGIIMLVLFPL